MFTLLKNSSIQVFGVTLSEKSTLQSPFYLFVFTNEVSNEVLKMVLSDVSLIPERINVFEIRGDVFEKPGYYSYKVYEQSTFNNTNEALAVGVVEEGRCFIKDVTALTFKEYTKDNTFKEYERN